VDRGVIAHQDTWKEQVRLLWKPSPSNESPALIKNNASQRNLPVVLLDERQRVADRYGVDTTPYIFIPDSQGIIRYQGAWDDITFRKREATVKYVEQALEALRNCRMPGTTQIQAYGCAMVRF